MDSSTTRSPVAAGSIVCGIYFVLCICFLTLSLAGEVCTEWLSWSKWFGISSILGQSLLQASIYNLLAVRIYDLLSFSSIDTASKDRFFK